MSLAERIKSLRIAAGWSQRQAAIIVGVRFTAYQKWESGVNRPTLDSRRKLAAAFNVPLTSLLGD